MKKVIVAVSGGPDSMALLDYLWRQDYEVLAVHVNYQMRASADRDQKILVDFCQEKQITYEIKYYTEEQTGNFQHKARLFRYDFFQEVAKQYGVFDVFLGHHLDDDLETYIFQKKRGMLSDQVGMAKFSHYGDLRIHRPFLKKSKNELISYCHKYKVPFGVDESNFELDYKRNRIRFELESLKEKEKHMLIKKMNRAKKERESLNLFVSNIVKSWENVISYESYAKIDDAFRILALRAWLRKIGLDIFHYRQSFFKDLDYKLLNKKAKDVLASYYLISSYDEIAVYQKQSFVHEYKDFESLSKAQTDFYKISLSGELLSEKILLSPDDFPVRVRSPRKGDRILLSFGHKAVNRYFIDEKIPHYLRETWPVIVNQYDEVIFVAKIGSSLRQIPNNMALFMVE